ncbi:hypothetical protein P154DRAFT_571302 [Amniculicola lignicola CBS 123094]|uniref:Uncharacterized protein n=1 Tax=Amniculicola lignicola CBS 123094 TaxID=1392246 RepID=A0A6A5X289_9PLEO|nr:hypothetical protein P154DRAFT_571302 [Amniculicola lignicola CBS 123094]
MLGANDTPQRGLLGHSVSTSHPVHQGSVLEQVGRGRAIGRGTRPWVVEQALSGQSFGCLVVRLERAQTTRQERFDLTATVILDSSSSSGRRKLVQAGVLCSSACAQLDCNGRTRAALTAAREKSSLRSRDESSRRSRRNCRAQGTHDLWESVESRGSAQPAKGRRPHWFCIRHGCGEAHPGVHLPCFRDAKLNVIASHFKLHHSLPSQPISNSPSKGFNSQVTVMVPRSSTPLFLMARLCGRK